MHGTTKAILIAAAALQASANPLYNRQAPSSSASIPSASLNSTISASFPTPTATSGNPAPTDPTFPFPGFPNGTNGTYYICSFPPTNDTAPTSSVPLSTGTVPLTTTVSSVTATASASSVLTDAFAVDAATSSGSVRPVTTMSGSATPVTTSLAITSFSVPTATPTPFTVVGPSTTITIECIQISRGGHPHPPPPGPITTSATLLPLPTLSAPPSNPVSSSTPTTV
ncbi:hypothetical protein FRC08_006107 [Ceratobasidium sp. 394]|nr:hypothetical protein FRC08_006107 [Ceratobasidium sp. 394]KAG9083294.1 hypothetical protein FS749_006152 [Ceratobasidium sp. UAMH 11750]